MNKVKTVMANYRECLRLIDIYKEQKAQLEEEGKSTKQIEKALVVLEKQASAVNDILHKLVGYEGYQMFIDKYVSNIRTETIAENNNFGVHKTYLLISKVVKAAEPYFKFFPIHKQ